MKVLIAGLGLIGGSLTLALRERGLADEILGIDSSAEHARQVRQVRQARRLGLADRIVTLDEGIPEARLIVLATPEDTLPPLAVKVLDRIGEGQVAMDMGSIKEELCQAISMHARRGRFVAAHPMWGTEHSRPHSRDATSSSASGSAATRMRWRRWRNYSARRALRRSA